MIENLLECSLMLPLNLLLLLRLPDFFACNLSCYCKSLYSNQVWVKNLDDRSVDYLAKCRVSVAFRWHFSNVSACFNWMRSAWRQSKCVSEVCRWIESVLTDTDQSEEFDRKNMFFKTKRQKSETLSILNFCSGQTQEMGKGIEIVVAWKRCSGVNLIEHLDAYLGA